MTRNANSRPEVEIASGNVFADLGFPDAAERTVKTALAVEINRILKTRTLSQVAAARILGINQPKISALAHFRLEGFSVERLMNFLTALGRDIEISIRPVRSRRKPGRILVDAR